MQTREVALDTAEGLLEFSHTGVVGDEYGGYTIVADRATSRHGSYERRRLVVRDIADGSLWELPYERRPDGDRFGDPVRLRRVYAWTRTITTYVTANGDCPTPPPPDPVDHAAVNRYRRLIGRRVVARTGPFTHRGILRLSGHYADVLDVIDDDDVVLWGALASRYDDIRPLPRP